jgi:hypothetical protein
MTINQILTIAGWGRWRSAMPEPACAGCRGRAEEFENKLKKHLL